MAELLGLSTDVWIYIIITLILVILGSFFLYIKITYREHVRIREITNGRKRIKDHRAKYYEDGDGMAWWRISGERKKTRKLLPCPPEQAIELTKKGHKCAECYRTETGDVIWLVDKGGVAEFPKDAYNHPDLLTLPAETLAVLVEEKRKIGEVKDPIIRKELEGKWKKDLRYEWQRANNLIVSFDPVNSKQRKIYLDNLRKAEQRKGLDWKAQLVPIASIAVLGLVVISGMIFWGDLAQPALQANAQALSIQENQKEILGLMLEIKTGQQQIGDRVNSLEPLPD